MFSETSCSICRQTIIMLVPYEEKTRFEDNKLATTGERAILFITGKQVLQPNHWMMFVLLFVNAGFTSLHTSRSLSSGKGSTWYPKVLYSYTPHKLLGLLKYKDTCIIYILHTTQVVRHFKIKIHSLYITPRQELFTLWCAISLLNLRGWQINQAGQILLLGSFVLC